MGAIAEGLTQLGRGIGEHSFRKSHGGKSQEDLSQEAKMRLQAKLKRDDKIAEEERLRQVEIKKEVAKIRANSAQFGAGIESAIDIAQAGGTLEDAINSRIAALAGENQLTAEKREKLRAFNESSKTIAEEANMTQAPTEDIKALIKEFNLTSPEAMQAGVASSPEARIRQRNALLAQTPEGIAQREFDAERKDAQRTFDQNTRQLDITEKLQTEIFELKKVLAGPAIREAGKVPPASATGRAEATDILSRTRGVSTKPDEISFLRSTTGVGLFMTLLEKAGIKEPTNSDTEFLGQVADRFADGETLKDIMPKKGKIAPERIKAIQQLAIQQGRDITIEEILDSLGIDESRVGKPRKGSILTFFDRRL